MSKKLKLFWYDKKTGEEVQQSWGQVAGSMHRLLFVREELNLVLGSDDIDYFLDKLQYHIENYLFRAYELRERTVILIEEIAKIKKLGVRLKNKNKRPNALSEILCLKPELVEPTRELLSLLDSDLELRNFHTHETFLSLGLWIESNIFDPKDALIDLKSNRNDHKKMENFLRDEMKLLASEYATKIDRIAKNTYSLLEISDPFI